MRELLKRDITLTSICALYHEIMHKTSGVRNEIYLKLSKHFLEEEKLSKDEKILLSKMYLGREGEDNIVNLIINKRGITCILYDCFLKLLLMGLEYEDQDILRVVNSAMHEFEEEILKKCILNISYNSTREYWVQWEKMGQHTLFGDFYKDLDEAYKKINCLIEVQKNVSVDSVYGNEFFWCLKSIKEQLCTLIFNGIFIVECTGKKMEFNIHMHDVSRMKLKAFVVGDCAFAGYNTREMGVHLEEDEEHNIISVRQKANTDKYYLVFFREFDWINREKGIRQVVSAKKWKIHKSRFGKKDYEYKEPEASELQKRKRRI